MIWQAAPFSLESIIEVALNLFFLASAILAHEVLHALAARQCGIATQMVMFMPFGGVALFERPIEKPAHTILVAAAGPLANIAIAFGAFGLWLELFVLISIVDLFYPGMATALPKIEDLAEECFVINLAIAIFNLIPALPLDGGHILRGTVMLLAPRREALVISASSGLIGVGFAILSIQHHDILLGLLAVVMLFIAVQAIVLNHHRNAHGTSGE